MKTGMIEVILTCYRSPDDSNNENYIEFVRNLECGTEKLYLYPDHFEYDEIHNNYYASMKILIRIDEKTIEIEPGI